ncbi:MAG: type VI secretion system protein, partial [Pseudomonadota bacterium]|nr:type VI secretion system protein [Pseudomonadota bacterium]
GKTSLFNSVFHEETSSILTSTQDCAIWHNSDNLYIELGERFLPRNDDDKSCRLLFSEFLQLCAKLNVHFHDIILILPINTTFTGEMNNDLKRIQYMLTTFIADQPDLPITIIFSKCDEIAGFKAFFADLGPEERAQYCGFRLPLQMKTQQRNERIREQLLELGQRFNDRLLARLQQELSQKQRSILHDFPYQYDLFNQNVMHLLNELLPSCDININGVFLTSSRQQGATVNHLTEQLREIYTLTNYPQSEQVPQQIAFFTRDLLTNLLPEFAKQSTQFLKFSTRPNPLFVPIVATGLIGLAVFQLYLSDAQRVKLAALTINQSITKKHDIVATAMQLDALKNAIAVLEQPPALLGKYLRPAHPQALIKKAQTHYDQLLH